MTESTLAATAAANCDIHEFVHGQKDCRNGVPHKEGRSESYDTGYMFEYSMEQMRSKGSN